VLFPVAVPEDRAFHGLSEWKSPCLDGTRWVSSVFFQAGFEMDGEDDQSEDGWWSIEGVGESRAWADAQAFTDYWTKHGAKIIRLGFVLKGDIVLYDVNLDQIWDYTAIVVEARENSTMLVSGRGSVSCDPSEYADTVPWYYINPGSLVAGLAMPYDD